MRFRQPKVEHTESEEHDLVESLQSLRSMDVRAPDEHYWAQLLVRTNKRLDESTSGKALSISWAARVAIPGIVAIICFFVGLHYYGLEPSQPQTSVSDFIFSLPAESTDSLLLEMAQTGEHEVHLSLSSDMFTLSGERIAEYLLEESGAAHVLEALTEQQVQDFFDALRTTSDSTPI